MAQDFAIFGICTNLHQVGSSIKQSRNPNVLGWFFFQTLTLGMVSTNPPNIIQRFHTARDCRVSPCTCTQVTSGHVVVGLMFAFFVSPKSSRCSCDRSFLRCMLPLNQRDLLTELFPLIHVRHGGLGASAWTVSGTEISRPFATPSRGVFVHQPRNPS